MAGGVLVPCGRDRPLASMTRMVSMPERGMGAPVEEARELAEDDEGGEDEEDGVAFICDDDEELSPPPTVAGVGVADRSGKTCEADREPRAPSLISARGIDGAVAQGLVSKLYQSWR